MTDQTTPFTPAIDVSQTTVTDMFGQILQQKIQDGVLEQAISKRVDKLIEDVAGDALSRYSDLGKALSEGLVKSITPNIGDLTDLPVYHQLVLNSIKMAAKNFTDNRLKEAVDTELQEVLQKIPEKVSLSWLIEQITDRAKSMGDDDEEGQITLLIEESRCGSTLTSVTVYISSEADEVSSNCDYKLTLLANHHNDGYTINSLSINNYSDHKFQNQLKVGPVYGMDKILFNLYVMKGEIELDCGLDPYDYKICWSNYED